MIVRNIRSLHWRERLLYCSSLANNNSIGSYKTATTLHTRIQPAVDNTQLLGGTPRQGPPDIQGFRRPNFSAALFCYDRLAFSFLQNARTITHVSHSEKDNDRLLRASGHGSYTTRLYSTNPPESQPPLPKKSPEISDKPLMSWKNLLTLAGIATLLAFGIQYLRQQKELERTKMRNKYAGKALLGGEWTLTDHHGNRRSSKDFLGQWLLIYFGFTHCPDVCPEEIEKIVEVINKTDANEKLPKIQPIIITVDPDRDTPAALKDYCAEFSPRLLGFTGSPEEIQQATHAYRVYFSAGPKDDDNDYIVDHSIISYLVNPEGEFVDFFGQNKTVNEIYNSIYLHILTYLKKQKSKTDKSV